MTDGLNKVPRLNELYVYVTNSCNCACQHCWIIPEPQKSAEEKHFIAPDVLDHAILEAVPLGLTSLKWTGGEPTIHPDFVSLLAVQKRHRLKGRMETNGMAVTPGLAALLLDSGVDDVSVSLDGASAGTHDAIRHVAGGFERTLTGIRTLVDAGIQTELIMSLLCSNLGEVEGFLDLAGELGVGAVKLNIVQPSLRGADLHTDGEVPPVREILALQERISNGWRAAYGFTILLDVPLAFRPLHELFEPYGLSRCGIHGILGLLADGHYALCGVGEHKPELVFGRAGVGKLDELWKEHPVLQRLRTDLPNGLQGVCGHCLMRDTCLGSCVATNYEHGKDLLSGYWFCEQALAEGLFPQRRLKF